MKLKSEIITISLVLMLSYSVYFFLEPVTIANIGTEDHLVEWLTALSLLGASFLFALRFLRSGNLWLLLLTLAFFFGFGEEISWGQRVVGFQTPELIRNTNVQGEFNIHNLLLFNTEGWTGVRKSGISRLLEINFLFKLFCIFYGIVLPLMVMFSGTVRNITNILRIPLPSLKIGIFFLINWIVFRVMLTFALVSGEQFQYYDTATEIFEFIAAFIFLALGFSMYFKASAIEREYL